MSKKSQSAAGEERLITLTSKDVATLVGGDWERLSHPVGFSGVSVGEAEVAAGELYIPLTRAQWGGTALAALEAAQAGGIVVPRDAQLDETTLPTLRVDDPRDALRLMAEENSRRAKAKRILVTGTEGKTGLKIMLHHIMSRQTPCHAVLNSSNLHVPIWRSLASIRREDEFAIVEISVAQPNRGWQRSNIVRPHFCVFTNISSQHTALHGSLERLIRNKAEAVTALQPGGVCFINADNDYFLDLKDAIQRIKRVPVMSFGSRPDCDGRLLNAAFVPRKGGWQVQARIFGRSVNYFVSMVNSYAPLASVSALTVASYLGLDLALACASLADFQPFETAGRVVTLPVGDGEFTLADHSLRGSVAGFRSAFDDLQRIAGGRKARLVLGAIRDLAEHEKVPIHEELASLIAREHTEKIYTVGDEMRIVRDAIADKALLGPHGDTYETIMQPLFDDIRPGDVVFVKGHHRVWLSLLVTAMEARFLRGENAGVGPGASASQERKADANLAPTPRIRLVAGGDAMLSRDIPGLLASAGIDSAFREVKPLLASADIALVNLECVISGCGDFFDKGEGRPYFYRCPPAMADVLVQAGITAVTVANNHAMDFGPEALADQARILGLTGIANAGHGADAGQALRPAYLRVGKLIVALLSFATDQQRLAAGASNGGICQTELDRDAVKRLQPLIETARHHADLVIASPHWGANWKDAPSEDIRRLAWALIDLGVDAVLGHSAHILQGIEVYRGKPIVYDMGSILFDRVRESRMRHSALFELHVGDRGVELLVVHPVELEPGSVRPANDQEGEDTLRLIESLSRELDPAIEFRRNGGTLELRLEPRGIGERGRDPEQAFEKGAIRALPAAVAAESANIIHDALPAGLDAQRYVDLGGGLQVFGARFPEQGRAGCGFALEVFFRCPQTEGRRWRASIVGIDAKTGEEFRYRHPVSEGMWVSQGWQGERIVSDRIVVRPPANLAPASYELYWNLVDADTGNLRKTVGGDPRIKGGWLSLGTIAMNREAPQQVAGLANLDRLPMRILGEPGGSAPAHAAPAAAIAPSPSAPADAMAGLRRLALDDLPRYKAALAEAKRTTWQHYFPFLYLFSASAKTEHIWISEEDGSLCVYRRNLSAGGPRLFLASLPMPMNVAVLQGCLARIREHNQSQSATIYWVDEEDLGALDGLGIVTAEPSEPDYLYDPKAYQSLSGGKYTKLRRNLAHLRAHHEVELRTYTQGDLADCLALMDEWAELQKDKHDKILYQRYTRDCLKLADQFDDTDLFGRVALIDGKIRSMGFGGEMRPGFGNYFIAYSDHRIKGLNYFMITELMRAMEGCGLVNGGRADTPGVKFAKETLCPVALHTSYRVKIQADAQGLQNPPLPADAPPGATTEPSVAKSDAPVQPATPDGKSTVPPASVGLQHSEERAMAGLRRLSLEDLPRYKAALAQTRRIAQQHYFPFLHLFSASAKTEHIWISEESGSLCVYRRNLTAGGPRLFLASLPMPMNVAVLEGCLARIREHNQSQSATIYWVDEEDLDALKELGGITAMPYAPDYLFNPSSYRSLSGRATGDLRRNLAHLRAHHEVELRAYTQGDLVDCLALMDEWAELQKDKHDKILYQRYTRDCLKFADQFEAGDLFGRVVLVGGKIRSFGFAGEMRPGLGNLFLAYSDHRIKGINHFLKTQMMLVLEDCELVNDGRADTPGLVFAKEALCPVAKHNVYRVRI